MFRIYRALLALSLLCGPIETTAAQAASSTLRAADLRVAEVGYRLALSGARFCPNASPVTGMLLHHLAEYDAAGRTIEVDRYGLDRGPGILAVVGGSSADEAGLVAGDVLLSVNGHGFDQPRAVAALKDVPGGARKDAWRGRIGRDEAKIEDSVRSGPADLLVLRQGREFHTMLSSKAGCIARVRLAVSTQANAFANDGHAILTTEMLRLIRNDDELAVVLGHEMAHVILNHEDVLEAQNVPHGLLRGIGRNAARVKATEEEADRLGLKLAWAAGYDISKATDFWDRFYAAHPTGPQIFATHPGRGARQKLVAELIRELGSPSAPTP